MPNYLANRWFSSTSEMSSFVVDSSDEDGLGPFLVRTDDTTFKLVVWRKLSTATIDNDVIYAANGPGRWVTIASSSGGGGDSIYLFIDLEAMEAYASTPSETILYGLQTTPPIFYAWDSASTETEDGDSIVKITALATGRMYKIYPPPSAVQNIVSVANLAALKTLTSASELKLYYLNQTPPILYCWDAESTATADDDLIVKLTSITTGRMYKIFPSGGGGTSTIVSDVAPSTVLASGTEYVWTEDSSGSYSADPLGRYPDSLITYVSNGSVWLVKSANIIVYELAPGQDPNTFGKPPNSVQEMFLNTYNNSLWAATISSSSTLSWITLT